MKNNINSNLKIEKRKIPLLKIIVEFQSLEIFNTHMKIFNTPESVEIEFFDSILKNYPLGQFVFWYNEDSNLIMNKIEKINIILKYCRNLNEQIQLVYDLEDNNFKFLSELEPFQLPIYVFMNGTIFRKYIKTAWKNLSEDKKDKYEDIVDDFGNKLSNLCLDVIQIYNSTLEEVNTIVSLL